MSLKLGCCHPPHRSSICSILSLFTGSTFKSTHRAEATEKWVRLSTAEALSLSFISLAGFPPGSYRQSRLVSGIVPATRLCAAGRRSLESGSRGVWGGCVVISAHLHIPVICVWAYLSLSRISCAGILCYCKRDILLLCLLSTQTQELWRFKIW